MSEELYVGNRLVSIGDLVICPIKGVPLERSAARKIERMRGRGSDTKPYVAHVDPTVKDDEVG